MIFVGKTEDPKDAKTKAEPDLGIMELRYCTGTVTYTRKAVVSPKAAAGRGDGEAREVQPERLRQGQLLPAEDHAGRGDAEGARRPGGGGREGVRGRGEEGARASDVRRRSPPARIPLYAGADRHVAPSRPSPIQSPRMLSVGFRSGDLMSRLSRLSLALLLLAPAAALAADAREKLSGHRQPTRAEIIPAKAKRGETVTYRITVETEARRVDLPAQVGHRADMRARVLKHPAPGDLIFVDQCDRPAGRLGEHAATRATAELVTTSLQGRRDLGDEGGRLAEGDAGEEDGRARQEGDDAPGVQRARLRQQCLRRQRPAGRGLRGPRRRPVPVEEPVQGRGREGARAEPGLPPSRRPRNGGDAAEPARPEAAPAEPGKPKEAEAGRAVRGRTEDGARQPRQDRRPRHHDSREHRARSSLTAAIWGLISLVTPCVFPMIPITVSIFLKHAHGSFRERMKLAGVYCLTIIVVLGLSAFALLKFMAVLSVHPVTNVLLGLLFVVLALSLFGMYELTLPNFMVTAAAGEAGAGRRGRHDLRGAGVHGHQLHLRGPVPRRVRGHLGRPMPAAAA